MPLGDALKTMREENYASPGKKDSSESSGARVIQLTDDEQKELQGYQKGPGMEQECTVTGKLEEDGHFHVMSVRSPSTMPDQEMNEMAGQVAKGSAGGLPMVNMQTQPSPS